MQQACPEIQFPIINCSLGNKARMMCTNPTCIEHCFTCDDENCAHCVSKHRDCTGCWLQPVLLSIKQKRKTCPVQVKQACSQIEQIYEEAINKIKQRKEKILLQFQFYGLSESEAYFTKLILDGNINKVHGKQGSKIIKQIQQSHQIFLIQGQMTIFWKKLQKDFETVLSGLDNYFKYQNIKVQSKILTSPLKQFNRMFNTNVIRANLLFRATEEGFSIQNFYKKCQYKQNIMIVAATKQGKILGGFTPLSFNRCEYAKAAIDISVQSFLYSYEGSDLFKFQLIQPGNAIYLDANSGPIFGSGYDMHIPDSADKVGANYNIGNTYIYNGQLPEGKDKDTLFAGKTGQILLKQWQVFELEFCPKLRFKKNVREYQEMFGGYYGGEQQQ